MCGLFAVCPFLSLIWHVMTHIFGIAEIYNESVGCGQLTHSHETGHGYDWRRAPAGRGSFMREDMSQQISNAH